MAHLRHAAFNGTDIYTVSKMLGHKDLKTTKPLIRLDHPINPLAMQNDKIVSLSEYLKAEKREARDDWKARLGFEEE